MKKIKRDVPGHCVVSDRCDFFMHTDLLQDIKNDAYSEADFCVSLIGEYRDGRNTLNGSGKTYELMVFDKRSKNPWSEIEAFYTDNKDEAMKKFRSFVRKYSKDVRL